MWELEEIEARVSGVKRMKGSSQAWRMRVGMAMRSRTRAAAAL